MAQCRAILFYSLEWTHAEMVPKGADYFQLDLLKIPSFKQTEVALTLTPFHCYPRFYQQFYDSHALSLAQPRKIPWRTEKILATFPLDKTKREAFIKCTKNITGGICLVQGPSGA